MPVLLNLAFRSTEWITFDTLRIMNRFGLITFAIILAIRVAPVIAQTQQSGQPEGMDLMRSALASYQAGKMEEAEAKARKALSISPKDPRIHIFLAYVYVEQKKLKEASEAFGKAIKLNPTDKDVYLVKAQVDNLRNAQSEALASVRKAIELDPKFADAHLLLGKMLENDLRQADKAIAAYQTAVSINPQLFQAHEALAELFVYKKDLKSAEENYRKSVALDPKHTAGRNDLGRMLVEQGRLAEARELWEGRTSDEDDTRPTFIAMLTRAEKLKRATEAAAQHPNDPVVLVELGFAVMEGDSWVFDERQRRAIVHFRKALALKPDYVRAQYGIVKAYIELESTLPADIKNLNLELVKLRKVDAKLADEMVEYRKKYQGELIAEPFKP